MGTIANTSKQSRSSEDHQNNGGMPGMLGRWLCPGGGGMQDRRPQQHRRRCK